jgi:hypothetical protein
MLAALLLVQLALAVLWVITTTIWCSLAISTISSVVSWGTWINAVSSYGALIRIISTLYSWVVLKQLHGLLLSVSVHPFSSIIAAVVVVVGHLLGFLLDLHKHLGILWLHRLLLCRHLLRSRHLLLLLLHMHLLRMLDLTGRSTRALAGSLPSSGHL